MLQLRQLLIFLKLLLAPQTHLVEVWFTPTADRYNWNSIWRFGDGGGEADTNPSVRKNVLAKAQVFPPQSGFTIYFKPFDVDDPYTLVVPIDTNDTGGVPTGGDNKGTVSLPVQNADTDANGVAEITFEVSLNPGDNYKMVADFSQAYVNQLTLPEVEDDDDDPAFAHTSQMLTVWRKAWIEADSMAAPAPTGIYMPGQTNYWKATLATATPVNATMSEVTLASDPTNEDDELNDGFLFFPHSGKSYTIVDHVKGGVITTKDDANGNVPASYVGKIVYLYDDDWDTPTALKVPMPYTLTLGARIHAIFAGVYVKPVLVDSLYYDSSKIFVSYKRSVAWRGREGKLKDSRGDAARTDSAESALTPSGPCLAE